MRAEPGVLVVVVNWNGWEYTAECLRSLLRMDYPNWRCLVIDNGSTDGSVTRLQSWFRSCQGYELETIHELQAINHSKSRTLLLTLPHNLGYGGACNVGFAAAQRLGYKYSWLLNNDTVVDERALRQMVTVAERDESIGVVGALLYEGEAGSNKVWAIGGGRVLPLGGLTWHLGPRPGLLDKVTGSAGCMHLDYVVGACMLVRSEAASKVNGFDRRYFMYWEDTDFSTRLVRAGWSLRVAEAAAVWHIGGASSGKVSTFADYHWTKGMVQYLRRYHPQTTITAILIRVSGKVLKRVARGRWNNIRAIGRGVFDGFRTLLP